MKIITCLGDSITDCGHCFCPDSMGNGYVKLLSERLFKEGFDCQVRNQGTDGFTIQRLLQRVEASDDFSNNIITILIGINDISIIADTGRSMQQQELLFNHFSQHYFNMITILAKQSSNILLLEPFIFPWPAVYKAWIPYVERMSKQIKGLASQFSLPFLPLHKELNQMAQRYGFSAITTDGIHLTLQGQKFIADKLYSCILEHNYV